MVFRQTHHSVSLIPPVVVEAIFVKVPIGLDTDDTSFSVVDAAWIRRATHVPIPQGVPRTAAAVPLVPVKVGV